MEKVITLKLEWLGKYRKFVGALYRSANTYSQCCRDNSLGEHVKFNPYEVQTLEWILENEDKNKNMKWNAAHLGMRPNTYSKNIQKMVEKGLLEKYHTTDNKKNVIIRVSDLGRKEYEAYSRYAYQKWFEDLFAMLDEIPEEYVEKFTDILRFWGTWPSKVNTPPEEIGLVKIEQKKKSATDE